MIGGMIMSVSDRDYFRQRAEEERSRAESAASPAAARVHLALASKYDSLVTKADGQPILILAGNDLRKQA